MKDFDTPRKTSDIGVLVCSLLFLILVAGAGFIAGRSSVVSPEDSVEAARDEIEVMDWQAIDKAVNWCNVRGWDSEPLYDQSYGWVGETDATQVIGVQCESYSSKY